MLYAVIWPDVEDRNHPRKNKNLPEEVDIPDEMNNKDEPYDVFRRAVLAYLEDVYGESPMEFYRPGRFFNYWDE